MHKLTSFNVLSTLYCPSYTQAMLAVAGLVAQELVTGSKTF